MPIIDCSVKAEFEMLSLSAPAHGRHGSEPVPAHARQGVADREPFHQKRFICDRP
jgi:hypothetical protein